MNRHRLEVADVFGKHGSQFLNRFGSSLSVDQHRALRAITVCRTSVLGGHVERCDHCEHERISYNSCRNRHCPKCQAQAQAEWMEARSAELLPVPYFHVVFTLPQEIGPIALQNKRVVYGILLKAAAETLKDVAANPKHLGAEIGILAVLHTWGQKLMHHPHVHCVVTGGGIAPDRSCWVYCKRSQRTKKPFFAPVKVLNEVFRGKFIDFLKRAFRDGKLRFHGRIAVLAKPTAFEQRLNASVKTKWVVYAKRPFGGPEQVLKYLARYTHRVAISNRRLVALQDDKVHFRWRDYADGAQEKTMELDASEFIRRFLLHILPRGFVRIRHYGFLANRFRQEKLALCRLLLGVWAGDEDASTRSETSESQQDTDLHDRCPVCSNGLMVIVQQVPAGESTEARHVFASTSRSPPGR